MYLMLWVVSVALLLNLVLVPYGTSAANRLENFSLGTLSLSLSLGLLFLQPLPTALRALICGLLLGANMLCLLAFGRLFLRHATRKSQAAAAATQAWLTLGVVWEAIEEEFYKKLKARQIDALNAEVCVRVRA